MMLQVAFESPRIKIPVTPCRWRPNAGMGMIDPSLPQATDKTRARKRVFQSETSIKMLNS